MAVLRSERLGPMVSLRRGINGAAQSGGILAGWPESVSPPARHHDMFSQRLRADPTAKNTATVMAIDTAKGCGARSTKASSGTRPQTRKALKVLIAARDGERISCGRPNSSDSMKRI